MSILSSSRGHHIHYTDSGGPGAPVVMLHSFLMDGSMFEPQRRFFEDEFRIITVDARGHGQTPAEGPFTYWDVADDVIDVIEHLGVGGATIAGTSQGGFVALRVALKRPDVVSALILMGTSGEAEDPQVAEAYRGVVAAWNDRGPVDEVLAPIASICLGSDYQDATYWTERWKHVEGPHAARILDALVTRDDVLSRCGEIEVPALVLHGDHDAAYALERAQDLAAALPGSGAPIVIPGGAHFLSLTDSDAVNRHVATFLGCA